MADLLLAVVGATLLGRAAGEPGDDLVLVGDELDDGVELLAPPLQQLLQVGDLGERARVAVEQEARPRVLLLEARGDEPVGELVGDVVARVDERLHLLAELRAVLDVLAEDVARRDVGDAVFGGDALRLRALARAGRADDQEPGHLSSPS